VVAEQKEQNPLYAEPSDAEEKLKEAGTAEYATLVEAAQAEDGQLARLLEVLTEQLRRLLGSDLLLFMLYGSHARGEARPGSDVDLFVVLGRASAATCEKVRQAAYQVMWEADFAYVFSLYLTDVHHYQTLKQHGSSFLRSVEREGKVLWKPA